MGVKKSYVSNGYKNIFGVKCL